MTIRDLEKLIRNFGAEEYVLKYRDEDGNIMELHGYDISIYDGEVVIG